MRTKRYRILLKVVYLDKNTLSKIRKHKLGLLTFNRQARFTPTKVFFFSLLFYAERMRMARDD